MGVSGLLLLPGVTGLLVGVIGLLTLILMSCGRGAARGVAMRVTTCAEATCAVATVVP